MGKHSEVVKKKILEVGVKAWIKNPTLVTASYIGRMIGVNHANILYHFPHGTLREAVAKEAVAQGVSKIIVQLIATNHPAVARLKPSERKKHLTALSI